MNKVTTEELKAAGVDPLLGIRRIVLMQADAIRTEFRAKGLPAPLVAHLVDMYMIGAAAGAKAFLDCLLAAPGPEGRALVLASVLEDLQKLSEDPLESKPPQENAT